MSQVVKLSSPSVSFHRSPRLPTPISMTMPAETCGRPEWDDEGDALLSAYVLSDILAPPLMTPRLRTSPYDTCGSPIWDDEGDALLSAYVLSDILAPPLLPPKLSTSPDDTFGIPVWDDEGDALLSAYILPDILVPPTPPGVPFCVETDEVRFSTINLPLDVPLPLSKIPADSAIVHAKELVEESFDVDESALFCLCRKPEFGRMIACDAPRCTSEWYHLRCVGIKVVPRGKWFCPACRNSAI